MLAIFKLAGAAAAMMLSDASSGKFDDAPIYLVAEPVSEGLRFTVKGASGTRLEASFSLEVTSNGNRSVHRGSAMLQGREAVTLSVVTLGNLASGPWRARLWVEPKGGRAYEQVRESL